MNLLEIAPRDMSGVYLRVTVQKKPNIFSKLILRKKDKELTFLGYGIEWEEETTGKIAEDKDIKWLNDVWKAWQMKYLQGMYT